MNKLDIIREVSKVTCAGVEAKDAVEAFIRSVKEALKRGEKVTIQGFGSFYVKIKGPYLARNPKTGELISKEGKKVVKFRPSPEILE